MKEKWSTPHFCKVPDAGEGLHGFSAKHTQRRSASPTTEHRTSHVRDWFSFEVPGSRSGIPNLHLHIYTSSMSHWQKQSRRNGMCQIWQKRPTRKDLPPSKQEACFLLDLSCCLVHQLWGPECLPKTKETWKCHLRPNRDQDSISLQSTHISWREGSIPLAVSTPAHWAIRNVRPMDQKGLRSPVRRIFSW